MMKVLFRQEILSEQVKRNSLLKEITSLWSMYPVTDDKHTSFLPEQDVASSEPGRSGQTSGHRIEEVLTHSVDLSHV